MTITVRYVAFLALISLLGITGVTAMAVGADAGQAMPISGLLFWLFACLSTVAALIFGATFL